MTKLILLAIYTQIECFLFITNQKENKDGVSV